MNRLEGLASTDGTFVVACARTGEQPFPVGGLRFPDRETAADALSPLRHAERQLEMAELRLRLYVGSEFPRQEDQLRTQISLARAEIESLERRLAQYERFTRASYSAPLLSTIEETRLRLVATRLREKSLVSQLLRLKRSHDDRVRLYRLEIEEAQDALRRLRAADRR